jgi:regulator of replication initiation timing|tara:strand:- start:999 stop:1529 length:531 start_codon:yes stop_codon:yes gene_type:complete
MAQRNEDIKQTLTRLETIIDEVLRPQAENSISKWKEFDTLQSKTLPSICQSIKNMEQSLKYNTERLEKIDFRFDKIDEMQRAEELEKIKLKERLGSTKTIEDLQSRYNALTAKQMQLTNDYYLIQKILFFNNSIDKKLKRFKNSLIAIVAISILVYTKLLTIDIENLIKIAVSFLI